LLKELYAKHQGQGLVIIGVSLDDEAKPFQDAVSSKGLVWPQIRDGKDGQIIKLFNVQGTPTNYVLDREGRIAAKNLLGEKLAGAITDLLKSVPASTSEAEERDQWQKPDEVVKAMGLEPGQVVVDIGAG